MAQVARPCEKLSTNEVTGKLNRL